MVMLVEIIVLFLFLPFFWAIIVLLVSFGCLFIHRRIRAAQNEVTVTAITWGRCFIYELLNATQVYYLRIIYRLGYRIKKRYILTKKIPVILLHGYTDTPLVWYWFKKKLGKQYNGPIYAIHLKPVLASIEIMAEQLHQDLLEMFEKTQAKKIQFVCHSMGGLVAHYLIEHYKEAHRVQSLITLGTPWDGTKMSYFALGKNGKEMGYKSDFCQALLQKTSFNFPIVSIVSICDNIIIPWQSSKAYPQTEEMIVDTGHISLTFSNKVYKIVLRELLKSNAD